MIEVSFCTEQQLVETVTPSREHPVCRYLKMQASGDFKTLIFHDNMIVAVIFHPIWSSRVPPERKLLFSQGRLNKNCSGEFSLWDKACQLFTVVIETLDNTFLNIEKRLLQIISQTIPIMP